MTRFVRKNGCTPQNAPEAAQGSLTHIVTAYSGCRAGYTVVVGRVRRWPRPGSGRRGRAAADGGAGPPEVVWKFFSQFGRRPATARDRRAPDHASDDARPPASRSSAARPAAAHRAQPERRHAGHSCRIATAAEQSWTYTGAGSCRGSGNLCLDASGGGTSNGTAVIIWTVQRAGQPAMDRQPGRHNHRVPSRGCVWTRTEPARRTAREIILWSCHGQANQQWNLR